MAFWQTSSLTSINDGNSPNDGTGDTIRNAFIKVGNNFANISAHLAQNSIDFQSANIELNLNASSATISSLTATSVSGTTSSFTGNATAANVVARSGIYAAGSSYFSGNTTVSNLTVTGTFNSTVGSLSTGNVIPSANLQYSLGSPTNFFKSLYVGALNTVTQVSLSSAASILDLQGNVIPGTVQDIGIVGKYSLGPGAAGNAYSFFGQQYSSNAFIYVTGLNSDPAQGSSIVTGGVFGNTHFGSQWISNTTSATSTTTGALIVSGGAGVAGNLYAGTYYGNIVSSYATVGNLTISSNIVGDLNVNGNLSSNGYVAITASPSFVYGTPYTGGFVSGNTIFLAQSPSTSYTNGAVTIPNGGLGVGGNLNVQGGINGTLYGVVATASQPYITSLGSLTALTMAAGASAIQGNLQATTIGVGTLTASTITVTSSLTGVTSLSVGLLNSTTMNAVTIGNVGSTLNGATLNAATSVTTAALVASTSAVTNTLTANTSVTTGTVYANGVNSSTIGNAGAQFSGASITTTANAVTNLLQVNTVTAQIFGNTNAQHLGANLLATANVTTSLVLANTVNAAIVGNTGAVIYGNLSSGTIANLTSVGTLVGLAVAGNIYPTSNLAVDLGGTTNYWGNIYANTLTVSTITVGNAGLVPSSNVSANIGNQNWWFNTVYGKSFIGTSTTAKYADLAEKYLPDADYEIGTVVCVGGVAEITASSFGRRAIGAISGNPAYKMNSDLDGGVYVALKGRVPVRVVGTVTKGANLIAADGGCASVAVYHSSEVFAIALESSNDNGIKLIEAIIL